MSFEKMLEELEVLKKAQAIDEGDKAIAAAAEDPDGDGDGEKDDDEDGDGNEMSKAITVFDAEGNPLPAVDGTEMIKSLQAELDGIKAERADENMHLGKSLELVAEMLKSQGEQIAALTEQMSRVAGEGRGRRAVVTVQSDMSKSEMPAAVSTDEVLAKCLTAQRDGKLSAHDVSLAESCVNRGMEIPARIRERLS
jgi:hypothetical protein